MPDSKTPSGAYRCPACGFTARGPANYCERCGVRLRETSFVDGRRLPDNPQARIRH